MPQKSKFSGLNPVLITKYPNGYRVRNEGGDTIVQYPKRKYCVLWCIRNKCTPVKSWKSWNKQRNLKRMRENREDIQACRF